MYNRQRLGKINWKHNILYIYIKCVQLFIFIKNIVGKYIHINCYDKVITNNNISNNS